MPRYLVISSDCHAGLPNEQYRDWLDPGHRDAFDAYMVERTKLLGLAGRGLLNEEFAEEWHRENDEGLRGGWDAARRDKELDADGVVGEVIFPDADAVVFGHSHIPLHEHDFDGGFQIFNPGSPTERRRSPRHSMAEIEVEDGRIAAIAFWAVDDPAGPLDPDLVGGGPR